MVISREAASIRTAPTSNLGQLLRDDSARAAGEARRLRLRTILVFRGLG